MKCAASNGYPLASNEMKLGQLKPMRESPVLYSNYGAGCPNCRQAEALHWKIGVDHIRDVKTSTPVGNAM